MAILILLVVIFNHSAISPLSAMPPPVSLDKAGEPVYPICPTEELWKQKSAKYDLDSLKRDACASEGLCDDPSVRDGVIRHPMTVRILVQVILDGAGQSPSDLTQEDIEAQILELNADYAPQDIQFSLQGIRWQNNDTYHCISPVSFFNQDWLDDVQAMKLLYAEDPDQQINIFISCQESSFWGAILGAGTFPWDPAALTAEGGLWVNSDYFGPGNKTLTHEMGHTLGLWHTHKGVSETTDCLDPCSENAHSLDDAAADWVGDFCKDTPATPVNYECIDAAGTDCLGFPWGYTMPENFMGYSPDSCMSTFTVDQFARVHCWVRNAISSVLEPPPPPVADFTATPLSGFAPLSVDFIDLSSGEVAEWDWDFGDGTGSSQANPFHQYASVGDYEVTLTITGMGGQDQKIITDCITVAPAPNALDIGEASVLVSSQIHTAADWYKVSFLNGYHAPAVIMSSLTYNATQPAHLRVRDVSQAGFRWQVEEWDYEDGAHKAESCPYIVMDSGKHTLERDVLAEAGIASCGTSWLTVSFQQSFVLPPIVLAGVQSFNDEGAVIARVRNVSRNSFELRLQEEEAADGIHAPEDVGWIAIQESSSVNNGATLEAGKVSDLVGDDWYLLSFGSSMQDESVILAQILSSNESDPGGIRYRNLQESDVELKIEEEQSLDGESMHAPESLAWLALFSAGEIKAKPEEDSPSGYEAFMPKQVPPMGEALLKQNYPNPFNPNTVIAFELSVEAMTRLVVYDATGRRIATLVDGRLPSGNHEIIWNGRSDGNPGRRVPAGVYFYRLRCGDHEQTRRMILLK